jgi:hypothetical protein
LFTGDGRGHANGRIRAWRAGRSSRCIRLEEPLYFLQTCLDVLLTLFELLHFLAQRPNLGR